MKCQKGGTIDIPIYIQDESGEPVSGLTLADITVNIDYLDNTAPDAGVADLELANGKYSYSFTDTEGKDCMISAVHASYQQFPGVVVEIVNVEPKTGTHAHADSNAEQDTSIAEALSPAIYKIRNIMLDLNALALNTTIRLKVQVNDANYRTIDTYFCDPTQDVAAIVGGFTTSRDWKITIQTDGVVSEGAQRNIPYEYILEEVIT